MFVRWKKRPTHANQMWNDWQRLQGDMLLSAFLVQSVRVNGKPRQKQQFLASIHLSGAIGDYGGIPWLTENGSIYERGQFWTTVNTVLAQMKLDDKEHQRIQNKLAETVKPLSREEQAKLDKKAELWQHPLKTRRSATI